VNADRRIGGTEGGLPTWRVGVRKWSASGSERLTRLFLKLRTEGSGRGQQTAAIGLGTFIGCTPFYGAHFWICMGVGRLLGLNRLKLYLAANISIPLVAPLLVFTEVQTGSLLRRGVFYELSVEMVRRVDPWLFAADLLIGSAVVGTLLAAAAAAATWWIVGPDNLDPADETIVAEASARYLPSGVPAWEFANGKLRVDPVYLDVLRRVPLPDGGRILDLGCGRGLMLSVLAEARPQWRGGPAATWVLHGLEYRGRMVSLARRALGNAAVIEQADLTACALPSCRTALLLDVLHLLPAEAQESLLDRLRAAVEPGGLLVVREADAAGGWRFGFGQACNRVFALLQGRWRRRFHFRTADEWAALVGRFGFVTQGVRRPPASAYANVLLWARRDGTVPGHEAAKTGEENR